MPMSSSRYQGTQYVTSVMQCTSSAAVYSSRTCIVSCKHDISPSTSLADQSNPSSPSPGAQAVLPRWSLAMFTRPSDTVILRALTEDSALVADAVANATNKDVFKSGQTSKEWFARRIKYQRTKNQKVGCSLRN